ncbi:probable magnesium transporter NIPA4 isoform X1, partial [Olea europaea subsp. europaea]
HFSLLIEEILTVTISNRTSIEGDGTAPAALELVEGFASASGALAGFTASRVTISGRPLNQRSYCRHLPSILTSLGNYTPLSPSLSTQLCAGNTEFLMHDEEDGSCSEEAYSRRQEFYT